jgi:hypothetical protein
VGGWIREGAGEWRAEVQARLQRGDGNSNQTREGPDSEAGSCRCTLLWSSPCGGVEYRIPAAIPVRTARDAASASGGVVAGAVPGLTLLVVLFLQRQKYLSEVAHSFG